MLRAPRKPSPDVFDWNMMSAFEHTLTHAANRFAHIWNPDEMQLDIAAAPHRFCENVYISPSA